MALPPPHSRFWCFQAPQLSTLTGRLTLLTGRLTLPTGTRQVSTCVLWVEASPGARGSVPKGCGQNVHLWDTVKSGRASRGTHCVPRRAGNTHTHQVPKQARRSSCHSQGPPGWTLWNWNWDPGLLTSAFRLFAPNHTMAPSAERQAHLVTSTRSLL